MNLVMADSPSYVNVKSREERLDKRSRPRVYKNINKHEGCDPEGYQTVHECGLDQNGEYTDLTLRTYPEEDDDATLLRERMINDLLFPPQKNAPRRFNYTDIQLTPVSNDEEPLSAADTCHTSGESSIDIDSSRHSNSSKPKIKPKPKNINIQKVVDKSSEDDVCADPVEAVEASLGISGSSHLGCTMSCKFCNKVVWRVLLMLCISISLVAVAIAGVAFVRQSRACEETYTYEDCAITPVLDNGRSIFLNNNCSTPPIAVMTKGTKVS